MLHTQGKGRQWTARYFIARTATWETTTCASETAACAALDAIAQAQAPSEFEPLEIPELKAAEAVTVGGVTYATGTKGKLAVSIYVAPAVILAGSKNQQPGALQPQVASRPKRDSASHLLGGREPARLNGAGEVEVSGESHYHEALLSAAGGHTPGGVWVVTEASLVPEPDNPVDRGAVAVCLGQRVVGHLGVLDAARYQPVLRALEARHRYATCVATLLGGFAIDTGHADFRVSLHLSPPDRAVGPFRGPGALRGRHWSEWTGEVADLKRAKKLEDAARLLRELVTAAEEEGQAKGWGPNHWPYDQLGIVLRKLGRNAEEVQELERYVSRTTHPHPDLVGRLAKARQLAADNVGAKPKERPG